MDAMDIDEPAPASERIIADEGYVQEVADGLHPLPMHLATLCLVASDEAYADASADHGLPDVALVRHATRLVRFVQRAEDALDALVFVDDEMRARREFVAQIMPCREAAYRWHAELTYILENAHVATEQQSGASTEPPPLILLATGMYWMAAIRLDAARAAALRPNMADASLPSVLALRMRDFKCARGIGYEWGNWPCVAERSNIVIDMYVRSGDDEEDHVDDANGDDDHVHCLANYTLGECWKAMRAHVRCLWTLGWTRSAERLFAALEHRLAVLLRSAPGSTDDLACVDGPSPFYKKGHDEDEDGDEDEDEDSGDENAVDRARESAHVLLKSVMPLPGGQAPRLLEVLSTTVEPWQKRLLTWHQWTRHPTCRRVARPLAVQRGSLVKHLVPAVRIGCADAIMRVGMIEGVVNGFAARLLVPTERQYYRAKKRADLVNRVQSLLVTADAQNALMGNVGQAAATLPAVPHAEDIFIDLHAHRHQSTLIPMQQQSISVVVDKYADEFCRMLDILALRDAHGAAAGDHHDREMRDKASALRLANLVATDGSDDAWAALPHERLALFVTHTLIDMVLAVYANRAEHVGEDWRVRPGIFVDVHEDGRDMLPPETPEAMLRAAPSARWPCMAVHVRDWFVTEWPEAGDGAVAATVYAFGARPLEALGALLGCARRRGLLMTDTICATLRAEGRTAPLASLFSYPFVFDPAEAVVTEAGGGSGGHVSQ